MVGKHFSSHFPSSRESSFAATLIRTNLRASVSLRGAFLLQAAFMMMNNFIFFSVWWIFFQRFDEIRGWKLPDLAALYGISAFSFGMMIAFGGGVWQLAQMIIDGELDTLMTKPRNLLFHIVASHSRPSGWGDMISGVGLIWYSGYLTAAHAPLVLLILLCSGVIFLASTIMVHSLAFWLGPIDHLSRQLSEFVITFSVYPQTIYPLYVKLILFTVIPSGFISFVPVLLLRNFDARLILVIVSAAVTYLLLANIVFQSGLRRYESGNRVGGKL